MTMTHEPNQNVHKTRKKDQFLISLKTYVFYIISLIYAILPELGSIDQLMISIGGGAKKTQPLPHNGTSEFYLTVNILLYNFTVVIFSLHLE